MSYTPHTWTVGDVITAERLNALEQGVASGGGGYDAEVYIHRESGSSTFSGTIVSGNHASLLSLLNDDTPPSILVRVCDEAMNNWFSTSAIAIYLFDSSDIIFYGTFYNSYGIVDGRFSVDWTSGDTISNVGIYFD